MDLVPLPPCLMTSWASPLCKENTKFISKHTPKQPAAPSVWCSMSRFHVWPMLTLSSNAFVISVLLENSYSSHRTHWDLFPDPPSRHHEVFLHTTTKSSICIVLHIGWFYPHSGQSCTILAILLSSSGHQKKSLTDSFLLNNFLN